MWKELDIFNNYCGSDGIAKAVEAAKKFIMIEPNSDETRNTFKNKLIEELYKINNDYGVKDWNVEVKAEPEHIYRHTFLYKIEPIYEVVNDTERT